MSEDRLYAPAAVDGTLVLQAALTAGCDIDLFPRQVMACWHPSAPAVRRSFVHGVPEATTLSGATYAQDKRVSRALLEEAGVPVVKGATFSFRGPRAALRYTLRTRFPVQLRMAIENSIEPSVRIATGRRSFRRAFDEIRRLGEDATAAATNQTRSAYSLTGLLDPVDDGEGNRLWAPSTRVLVERLPRRWQRFQVLLFGDEVVGVVGLGSTLVQPGDASSPVDATGVLSQAQLFGARAAAASIPGLDIARVELVAPTSGRASHQGRFLVRDVSERPNLGLFEAARPGWGSDLAAMLVMRSGVAGWLSSPAATTVLLSFEGLDDVAAMANFLSASGTNTDVNAVDGSLSLEFTAPTSQLASILGQALAGGFRGVRAMHASIRVSIDPVKTRATPHHE